jgi:type VI protein secretion system component VasK
MNMAKEPIALIAALEIAALAVVGVIVAFFEIGPEVATEIRNATIAISGAVAAVIIAVGTYFQRRKVDSPETVAKKVDEALNTPVPK